MQRHVREITGGLVSGITAVAILAIPSPEALHRPEGYDEQGCMVPSPQASKAASDLFEQPENPMVTRYNLSLSGKGPETEHAIDYTEYQSWTKSKAREYGLTLYNSNVAEHTELYNDPAEAAVFTAKFLGRYGITLSFGEGAFEMSGVDARVTTDEERQSKAMAMSLLALSQEVAKYPVEFLQRLKHDKIVIMRGLERNEGDTIIGRVAGEVNVSLHPGTIYLDYESPQAYDHELGHLLDAAEGCLNTDDPTLTKLNRGQIYGNPEMSPTISLEEVEEREAAAQTPEQFQAVKKMRAKAATVSEYGISDRDEDVAEVHKDMLRGFFGRYEKGVSPILDDPGKFNLQLARLYTFDPATARFIAVTSYRGNPKRVTGLV